MKFRSLFITAMMLAIMIFCSVSANATEIARGSCGEGLTWILDDAGLLTISGEGAMEDYSYNSYAPWVDYEIATKRVIIEDGVTSIGNYAFNESSRVYKGLTNIEMPNSVTSIGVAAFSSCESLKSVEIPNGVTSIGDSAFANCISLKSIKIPNGVTRIAGYTFEGCSNLTNVEMSDGITSIGINAFSWCESLKSIEIPSSVTSIGVAAFQICSSLTSVKIPDGVTSISATTFSYCSSLKNIEMTNSVTNIANYAFNGCSNLQKINYYGTKEEWNNITVGSNNECLTNLTPTLLVKINISINTEVGVTGKLIVCIYDKDNKLIGTRMEDADLSDCLLELNSFDVEVDGTPNSYKVMLWERLDNMKPYTDTQKQYF